MDADRFDALARSLQLATPRRAALGAIGGGLAALLARLGIDESEAKKRKKHKKKKKKCKGNKKKCGKKCIPKSQCCKDSECGDQQFCCQGACIDDVLCCTDADCGGNIYTCEEGVCLCPDPSEVPCSANECCDPDTQVCEVTPDTSACQSGDCPAGTDFCSDETFYLCGGPLCGCTTSLEGQTVCTDLAGVCVDCATDAECTTALGQDAVCIPIGEFCTCDTGETTACVAVGCPSGFEPARSTSKAAHIRGVPVKRLR